jgi:hypothetical protein
VVSLFATADARWTRLLDSCPSDPPVLAAEGGAVTLTWPARVERLDLATGWIQPARKAGAAAREDSKVVARAAGLTAIESRRTLHTNPFRWGAQVTVIEVRDGTTGYLRAQIVSDKGLTVLRLDDESVVVREGSEAIRYTLDSRD